MKYPAELAEVLCRVIPGEIRLVWFVRALQNTTVQNFTASHHPSFHSNYPQTPKYGRQRGGTAYNGHEQSPLPASTCCGVFFLFVSSPLKLCIRYLAREFHACRHAEQAVVL